MSGKFPVCNSSMKAAVNSISTVVNGSLFRVERNIITKNHGTVVMLFFFPTIEWNYKELWIISQDINILNINVMNYILWNYNFQVASTYGYQFPPIVATSAVSEATGGSKDKSKYASPLKQLLGVSNVRGDCISLLQDTISSWFSKIIIHPWMKHPASISLLLRLKELNRAEKVESYQDILWGGSQTFKDVLNNENNSGFRFLVINIF